MSTKPTSRLVMSIDSFLPDRPRSSRTAGHASEGAIRSLGRLVAGFAARSPWARLCLRPATPRAGDDSARPASLAAMAAAASMSMGRVTAGISQSQSRPACSHQAARAAARPAAASASLRCTRHTATAMPPGHGQERHEAHQAELSGRLGVERVRVPGLVDPVGHLEPFDERTPRSRCRPGVTSQASTATSQ